MELAQPSTARRSQAGTAAGIPAKQAPAGVTDQSVEVDAITGRQPVPESAAQSRAAEACCRHQPDLGLSEGIVDHLLFDQDESLPVERCAATIASRSRCNASSRSATRTAMPC